jgi:transcriptional regulator with XRE-family HTH domain
MRPMVDYRRVLGENVKTARDALHLSQEKLALEIDIDRTYISGIERGLRNPSLDVIVKIADRLQKTPGELLTAPERKPQR